MKRDDETKDTPRVEELKSALRLEETLPEADACEACAKERASTRDATALCREHLRRVLGV